LQQLQREQQAARRRLVEAQLQAMQARVDPQLLFDVLDRAQRLYTTDAPRAEALLDELIVFLRAAVPRMHSVSSTLAQELELAASYFRLRNLLEGAPAAARINLPAALASRAFPAGVILPLLSEAQTAAIDVDRRQDSGLDSVTLSLHTGRVPAPRVLAQVRDTLAALYGSAATLECHDSAANSRIETRITIAHAAP
jgi:LytS/YehU family sensor histidine kinase